MRKKDALAIEKIIECAKTEFLEKGFEGASMRKVAENAGYTTGMLYGRFADKGELFKAIVKASAENCIRIIPKCRRNLRAYRPKRNIKTCTFTLIKGLTKCWISFTVISTGSNLSSVKARAANTKSISIVLSKSKPKIPFVL